jgi:hypothetical protein
LLNVLAFVQLANKNVGIKNFHTLHTVAVGVSPALPTIARFFLPYFYPPFMFCLQPQIVFCFVLTMAGLSFPVSFHPNLYSTCSTHYSPAIATHTTFVHGVSRLA